MNNDASQLSNSGWEESSIESANDVLELGNDEDGGETSGTAPVVSCDIPDVEEVKTGSSSISSLPRLKSKQLKQERRHKHALTREAVENDLHKDMYGGVNGSVKEKLAQLTAHEH